MRGGPIVHLCVALWVLALAAHAAAQPESEEYRATVAEAVSEFQAGNWAEAKTLFRSAHRLQPSARTLRGLGLVAFELRQYVEAVDYLERALADHRKPLSEAQRAETQAQVARARRFVARYAVTLEPADATLSVDGSRHELKDGELLVAAGQREIVVSAPGYRSERRRLVVEGGVQDELRFRLTPEAAAVDAAAEGPGYAAPAPAAVDEPAEGSVPAGALVVGGLGAALLLAAAVTGPMALAAQADVEDACGNPSELCDARHEDKADRAETLALATDVLWVGGAAAVGIGLAWWLLSGDEPEPSGVSVRLGEGRAALWVAGNL